MKVVPLAWAMVVRRKALVRREAFPPIKSLTPQAKVAARADPAGASWEVTAIDREQ